MWCSTWAGNSLPARRPLVLLLAALAAFSVSADELPVAADGQASPLAVGTLAPPPAADNLVSPAVTETLLLAVSINGLARAEAIVLRLADGGLAVAERDLRAWRLHAPGAAVLRVDGVAHVRLADLAGVEYRLDEASQTLLLMAPAAAFDPYAMAWGEGRGVALTPSRPGGFFNYDLNWQRDDGRSSQGGLFELGLFNAWGSGTATGLWQNGGSSPRWLRLDTIWNVDMPERMQSLRLGDAIGRGGGWGRSVRFGGVQWATNFATQPGFVAFPMPGLRGEAVLPSTLDVYLDNARLLRTTVPEGPFDLASVPAVTGGGELQLVVRDLLGRQQVITQPYYASPQLLRPGLHDFSWDLGLVREDYGLASNRYGRAMLVGSDRLGITSTFTRELRAEILADQQTVGAGGVWLLPALGGVQMGTLSLAAALSHGPDGADGLLALGAERQARRGIGYSLEAEYAGRDFVRLGQSAGDRPRLSLAARLSLPVAGSGLGYLHRTTWQGDAQRLATANYSVGLGRFGHLGLSALQDLSGDSGLNVTLFWSVALDQRTSLGADLSRQDGRWRETATLQRNPPVGDGLGYRLLAGTDRRYQAGATVQAERGVLTAEAAANDGREAYRIGLSGGVAAAGGGLFQGRRVDDSFAVVKVADYGGVRVYRDNHEVTTTDAHGLALVSRLRAYEANPVGIEQADLPIDAEVDTLQVRVAPALRSGVVVAFPVRVSRSASFRLVDEAGQALPPGAVVRIEGDEEREFPVGYGGLVFVSGLAPANRLAAEWGGRRCTFELVLAADAEPLPDLGSLTCKGATP